MSLCFPISKKTAEPEPFGTLLAIRHESSGGSSMQRSEFSIELTPHEIIQCAYWPQDFHLDMVQKSHVPVRVSQWEDVEQITEILWPLFPEIPSSPRIAPDPHMRILDGGDYSRWFLTRQTENGVYTAQYSQPDDRRIGTLLALLRELAEPIGREIPRYAAPKLNGVYFSDLKSDRSYQCTPNSGDDGYRFIANDDVKKEKRSVYRRVPTRTWEEVCAYLKLNDLEQFPKSAAHDTVTCTLYFSDGRQRRVAPDSKTAKKLKEFFADLMDRIQSENDNKGEQ